MFVIRKDLLLASQLVGLHQVEFVLLTSGACCRKSINSAPLGAMLRLAVAVVLAVVVIGATRVLVGMVMVVAVTVLPRKAVKVQLGRRAAELAFGVVGRNDVGATTSAQPVGSACS